MALLGLPSVRLAAQESAETPPSKVERKNRAPAAREMLRVKIPKPTEAKLKNGLTVLILEDRRSPSVTVQLNIGGAGALFEPAALAGLAGTAAQMLREAPGRAQAFKSPRKSIVSALRWERAPPSARRMPYSAPPA